MLYVYLGSVKCDGNCWRPTKMPNVRPQVELRACVWDMVLLLPVLLMCSVAAIVRVLLIYQQLRTNKKIINM